MRTALVSGYTEKVTKGDQTMYRSTIVAGLAGVAIVAATWSTVAAADTDPCDRVPAAQQAVMDAEQTLSGTAVAYDVATDMNLGNRDRIGRELVDARVAFTQAADRYDAARDACR